MAFDVRKPNNSLAPTRSVYYNVHFCVRAFHRIISYPGYSLFILFIMYLQIMEIILYFKIRSRGLFDYSSSNTILNQTDNPQITPIFGSLPIKKIMIEPIVSVLIVLTEKTMFVSIESFRSYTIS